MGSPTVVTQHVEQMTTVMAVVRRQRGGGGNPSALPSLLFEGHRENPEARDEAVLSEITFGASAPSTSKQWVPRWCLGLVPALHLLAVLLVATPYGLLLYGYSYVVAPC